MTTIRCITIPVDIYEKLLQSYYFVKACRLCDIEQWEKYHDVEKLYNQLAVDDIIKENQDAENDSNA